MNWLSTIRQQYQLSTADLAMFLRVSVSMINKAEKGHRNLSAAAIQKLATLTHTMQTIRSRKDSSEKVMEARITGDQQSKTALEEYIKECRHQLQTLESRLQQMQTRYINALNMLDIVDTHRQQTASTCDPLHTSWLAGQEGAAMLLLYKNNKAAIHLLELKAVGLQAQIVAAVKMI